MYKQVVGKMPSSGCPSPLQATDELLDWTAKQGRILTANGKATSYYIPERGYSFKPEELPHHYLLDGSSWETFSSWATSARKIMSNRGESKEVSSSLQCEKSHDILNEAGKKSPICGAWYRPLFVGGWEHSTDAEERVYNIQTNTLFIDIRIPLCGRRRFQSAYSSKNNPSDGITNPCTSIEQLNDFECRCYARRHAFGGYTMLENDTTTTTTRPVCTRHHCIDWNFVGIPRPRPNKWFVEMKPIQTAGDSERPCESWKEWAFAKDDFGQHYYWERWSRLEGDGGGNELVLALRRKDDGNERKNGEHKDGILVIVGDHFNYLTGNRPICYEKDGEVVKGNKYNASSLVDLVDKGIDAGDRDIVNTYLSTIDAGHGTISSGWIIDCALQYWREGSSLLTMGESDANDGIKVDGKDIDSCTIQWLDGQWDVFESSITDIDELRSLFGDERKTNSVPKKRKLES